MLCYVNLCYEMLYSMCCGIYSHFTLQDIWFSSWKWLVQNIHIEICIKKGKGMYFKSELRFSFLWEDLGVNHFLFTFFSYKETQADVKGSQYTFTFSFVRMDSSFVVRDQFPEKSAEDRCLPFPLTCSNKNDG